MGTRSLTTINDYWIDNDGKPHQQEIAVLYRQMDGYPEGHGADLVEFLKRFKITNGLSLADDYLTIDDRFIVKDKTANGMDCLAAQIVAHFKDGAGGIYLMRAGTRDSGEAYIYTVYKDKEGLKLKVEDTYENTVLYDDLVDNYNLIEKETT